MRDPLPLSLDSKCHIFALLSKLASTMICKKILCCFLLSIGIVAISGLFSQWLISVVSRCKNATETNDFLKSRECYTALRDLSYSMYSKVIVNAN